MAARATQPAAVPLGAYLTDGMRLFQVLRLTRAGAIVEDCYSEKTEVKTLAELGKLELVRG